MLGYITPGTNVLNAASRFYDSLFAEINVQHTMSGYKNHGYMVNARDNEFTSIFSIKSSNGETRTIEMVLALFQKVIALGTRSKSATGYKGNEFYAAYFHDLDNNKLKNYCMVDTSEGVQL